MEQASKNLSAAALANLEKWLTDPKYDEFKSEILAKIELGDWLELESAFYKDLEFGTAGRRGRVGVGPNRLNEITVGESAQALAEYLSLERIKDPAVVIARDVRNSSPELAVAAAEVLAANGVLVYFFDDFRSTPELSFAVRQLRASAGIVISASHNPPSDNGIKIYWSDGGQITSPHDHNLLAIAGKLNDINRIDFLAGVESGKIKIIGAEIDQEYLNNVLLESRSQVRDLKVVFSPLHGAGVTNLLPVLERAGFEVEVVKEQFMADGDFSNVDNQNPNPEAPSARKMAEKILRESQADIALVTDPDADRVAVMSREKSGEIQSFSGNQAAILATNFLLEKAEASQSLEGKFICKSLVTTRALTALADQYSVEIFGDLPVGFKYIAEKILEQKICGKHFLAGFEESYGGLVGDYARDKDAASFGLILAECAAELKAKNQTLGEKLAEIYQKIGWFYDQTIAIDLGDSIEADKPAKIIAQLLNGFEFFSDNPVKKQIVRLKSLPKSGKTADQLRDELSRDINPTEIAALTLEFGSPNQTITIRPSGTEPKMKIYWNWRFDQPKTSGEIQQILEQIKEKVNGCK